MLAARCQIVACREDGAAAPGAVPCLEDSPFSVYFLNVSPAFYGLQSNKITSPPNSTIFPI